MRGEKKKKSHSLIRASSCSSNQFWAKGTKEHFLVINYKSAQRYLKFKIYREVEK
jgi:hypothetical protein